MSMMAAFQAFFLTSLAACASALNPTGISFNETLKGFGTAGGSLNDTIEDFERYYAEGKVIDETMSFDLAIKVDNVDRWLNDTKHAATCRGHVEESAISAANLTVADQSNLRIFDGGVLPSKYFIARGAAPPRDSKTLKVRSFHTDSAASAPAPAPASPTSARAHDGVQPLFQRHPKCQPSSNVRCEAHLWR